VCLAAFINDPLSAAEVNAEFQVIDGAVHVVTICPIPKHTEVFLYYDSNYWTNEYIPRPSGTAPRASTPARLPPAAGSLQASART
jgi:hypothetical protein